RIMPFAFSGGIGEQLKIGNQALENISTVVTEGLDGKTSLSSVTSMGLGCTAEQLTLNFQDFVGDGVQDVFYQCVAYTPATYFVPVAEGSFRFKADPLALFLDGSCAAPDPALYQSVIQDWSLENSLVFERPGGKFEGTLAPDGRCLEKVRVNQDRIYNAGTNYERTYPEELPNFSNWSQYHRRRHQSVRYGLGKSLQSISGVRADLVTVNDQATDV